jgi:hypothetical protein
MVSSTKEMALQNNFETHRLEIYKPNATGKSTLHKVLYFTQKEAEKIAQSINSQGQFLVFGSESFPKFGCYLEEMSSEEIKNRQKRYFDQFESQKDGQNEQKEQRKKIKKWQEENQQKWVDIVDWASQECERMYGTFAYWQQFSPQQKLRLVENLTRIKVASFL